MATIVIAMCLDPEEDLDVMTEVGVGASHVSSNSSLVSTTALEKRLLNMKWRLLMEVGDFLSNNMKVGFLPHWNVTEIEA